MTSIPQSREQKELLVLGVAGIAVSPAQMAVAYRKLALELDHAPGRTGYGAGRAKGFSELRHGAQRRRAGHGDRGQDGTASDGPGKAGAMDGLPVLATWATKKW